MTISVVVADDQALVRVGFCGIIAATPGLAVVGEAGTGAQAVDMARATRPDVVLMDVRMPVMDGIAATRRITADARTQDTRVLILTTFDLDEYVYAALRAGASGFLVKDVEPPDLLQAVRVVARGDALLSPSVTRAVIAQFTSQRPGRTAAPAPGPSRPAPPGLATLTEREREVVCLVAAGLSNEEIATKLTVSPLTVKTHVSRAMTKVYARDRAQLVVLAFENGLVARPAG
jgi:DNA-binding NarL/FixJ family response regulator